MAINLSSTADSLINSLAGYSDDYLMQYIDGGSVDVATGQPVAGLTVSEQLQAAETGFKQSLVDGANILSGDMMLIVSPYQVVPDGAWFLIRGIRYSIVSPQRIYNGGELQVQKFHVRKS